ncbi:hypothetical protein LT85_0046 [Collimonas arenae]|uniref:Uncharacterized protein n=1 Tax=Collimonas arenae TaxID=279058 RepID=A0A0A1F3T8_9BURK|nr:hypothetical protein LT85_0046 [Collimonas arenae]
MALAANLQAPLRRPPVRVSDACQRAREIVTARPQEVSAVVDKRVKAYLTA